MSISTIHLFINVVFHPLMKFVSTFGVIVCDGLPMFVGFGTLTCRVGVG